MNAPGIILTCIFALIICVTPRVWAAIGTMAATIYLTQQQEVNLGGFHFTAIRLILLVGISRVIASRESRQFRFNAIDKTVMAYSLVGGAIYSLRLGTSEALTGQLGQCYDTLLSYFVFRGFISGYSELESFIEKLIPLIVPLSLFMVVEAMTGNNLFQFIGGMPPPERDGGFRCHGAFRGPFSAGIFGAALLPLFVGFGQATGRYLLAALGTGAAFTIMMTSHSSGPLMAFVFGVGALALWPMHQRMRQFRRGLVVFLIGSEIVMKAHVWFLIAKVSDLTGGDGWYRSQLINQFFVYYKRWWFMGTEETGDWMPTGLHIGDKIFADICNAYVNAGVSGGLLTFILYILIFVRCFQALGRALKSIQDSDGVSEKFVWCVGCALVAHAAAQISVQYWDQLYVAWWGFVAIISSLTSELLNRERVVEEQEFVSAEEFTSGTGATPA